MNKLPACLLLAVFLSGSFLNAAQMKETSSSHFTDLKSCLHENGVSIDVTKTTDGIIHLKGTGNLEKKKMLTCLNDYDNKRVNDPSLPAILFVSASSSSGSKNITVNH